MTNIRDIDGTLRIYTAGLVAERPVHEHIQDACDLAAEVLRLREVEAALTWLLLNDRRNDYIFEREPRDPVALAKALGWKGRE